MKFYFYIASVFFISSISFSQNLDYLPFDFGANPQWYEGLGTSADINVEGANHRFWFEGDTVVNNKLYHKCFASGGLYNGVDNVYDTIISNVSLVGYLREEDQKVFYMAPFENLSEPIPYTYGLANNFYNDFYEGEEYVMYDFTMNVGDTVSNNISSQFVHVDYVLDSVAAINFEGELKNAWYFSKPRWGGGYKKIMWIEGIGSTRGLLRPSAGYDLYGTQSGLEYVVWATGLRCFNDSANEVHFGYEFLDWTLASDINFVYSGGPNMTFEQQCMGSTLNIMSTIDEIDDNKVLVYQNPVVDYLNIDFGNYKQLPVEVTIYDQYGRSVYCDQLISNSNQLNLSHLSSGFYLVKSSGCNSVIQLVIY